MRALLLFNEGFQSPPSIQPIFSLGRIVLVVFLLSQPCLLLIAQSFDDRQSDSLELERQINRYGRADFIANARGILYNRLSIGNREGTNELLAFMERRVPGRPWLNGRERLLVQTILSNPTFFTDSSELSGAMRLYYADPTNALSVEDELYIKLQKYLSINAARLIARYNANDAGGEWREDGQEFYVLLINFHLAKSLRSIEEHNRKVSQFIDRYQGNFYAVIAKSFLSKKMKASTIGAGFSVDYFWGRVGGTNSVLETIHGPRIAGEFYWDDLHFILSLFTATVNLSSSVDSPAGVWREGKADVNGGGLGIGYGLWSDRFFLVPHIQANLSQLIERASSEEGEVRISTGARLGYQFGLTTGYRIASDKGPHLDIRLNTSIGRDGFASFASGFDGWTYTFGLGFALVRRPYRTSFSSQNAVDGE